MAAQPQVVSATELDNGFLGETVQVAIVTDDLHGAMDNLISVGIGPWMVFHVGPKNADMHYRGDRSGFSMTLAFTTHGSMMWEVIRPDDGKSIYTDFLEGGHSGLHHVAVDGGGLAYEDRAKELKSRGYEEIQGGTAFDGQVPFAYFQNGNADAPWIEIFDFPEGFEPQPDEWYPAPPPAA